jgi:hypothetical protein
MQRTSLYFAVDINSYCAIQIDAASQSLRDPDTPHKKLITYNKILRYVRNLVMVIFIMTSVGNKKKLK